MSPSEITIDGHVRDLLSVAGFTRADGIVSVTGAQLLAAVGRDGRYEVWREGSPDAFVPVAHFIAATDGDAFYCIPPTIPPHPQSPVAECLCHPVPPPETPR